MSEAATAAAAETLTIRRWGDADRLDELLTLVHGAFGALAISPPSSALEETHPGYLTPTSYAMALDLRNA